MTIAPNPTPHEDITAGIYVEYTSDYTKALLTRFHEDVYCDNPFRITDIAVLFGHSPTATLADKDSYTLQDLDGLHYHQILGFTTFEDFIEQHPEYFI